MSSDLALQQISKKILKEAIKKSLKETNIQEIMLNETRKKN